MVVAHAPVAAKNQGPAEDADNSKWLTDNKGLYNKFYYRLCRIVGAKEEWKTLKDEGSSEEAQRSFVNRILETQVPRAASSGSGVRKARKVLETATEGKQGEWMTYREACNKDGEDVVAEMVAYGTLTCRRNPNLPPTSRIPEPFCNQVAYVKETWSGARVAHTVETIGSDHEDGDDREDDPEDEQQQFQNFDKKFQQITGGVPRLALRQAMPDSAGGVAKKKEDEDAENEKKEKENKERDKITVQNLRKAHSMFERARREWQATVSQSAANQNTTGSKVELDLDTCIIEAGKTDECMMSVERKFLQGTSLVDSDIRNAAEMTTKLLEQIKGANKKQGALKAWFVLK